ncbi:hypothetical protein DFS34DRAFT_269002 [Phlyctochytrium arcticum]|nr:hypothetical protein DFS34DRAFT_269002 [Phlyctochytrium arcticum]
MAQLLQAAAENPLAAALCGFIFERHATEEQEKGGEFVCRQLVHGNKKIKPGNTTTYIPPSTRQVVDRVRSNRSMKDEVPRNAVLDIFSSITKRIPVAGLPICTTYMRKVKKIVDRIAEPISKKGAYRTARNQLYLPITRNYVAIDAWMPRLWWISIGGAEENLKMLGRGCAKLYWVLPPLYYDDFTRKFPVHIDQFALKINYPRAV